MGTGFHESMRETFGKTRSRFNRIVFLEGKTQITSILFCKNIAVVHLAVRIMLKFGADAEATHGGLTALEMAQEEDEGRSGSKPGLVLGWVFLENQYSELMHYVYIYIM